MAGPEGFRLVALTVCSLALSLGCAATSPGPAKSPEEANLPPQTLSQLQPETPPPAVPPVPAPAPDPTVIVVDPGGEESAPGNLVAAAQAEKERRRTSGPPVAVLHDKNIQEFAKNQKLTFANPESSTAAPAGAKLAGTPSPKSEESYWRDRGRELRERWKGLSEEIGAVRQQAADLRVRFYNTDDPYIRDAEVKPAWDRALDRIDSMEREIGRIREELERFQEEGQRAGALPAWLLEGIELEPAAEPRRDPPSEPGEPVIYEEKPH